MVIPLKCGVLGNAKNVLEVSSFASTVGDEISDFEWSDDISDGATIAETVCPNLSSHMIAVDCANDYSHCGKYNSSKWLDDDTNKADSLQTLFPKISSFLTSVDSDDSDWDEDNDMEFFTDDSEFESLGLNIGNVAASKSGTLFAASSNQEDDFEMCEIDTPLDRINKEWNEATKDVNEKSRSSVKVSFAPEDELEESFSIEMYERKGEWEMYARDRLHFKRRIEEQEVIISPCLSKEHRENVYQKLYQK